MSANKTRLYLYDTTLRDGAQTQSVDFSLDDKIIILNTLDQLGLDYIEGGFPGANPTDTEFFSSKRPLKNAVFTAFGMTNRSGRSIANDPALQAVLTSETGAICLFAKSWDYHVRVALGISNEENLAAIASSVRAIKDSGREAIIDCEHFFDGFKANPYYALACAKTAYGEGARWVVLCDTNGGTLPDEVSQIVSQVTEHIPGEHLGIHSHNDTDNAVANSLVAVKAGARQIQGTLNGLGERCGNANLTSIIPTLMLKSEFADHFEIGITPEALSQLTHASRVLDEILNRAPNRQAPYVGEAAFAHKGGIHVSAVQKDPRTYEHITPDSVGNYRKFLLSSQAGRSNILAALERLNLEDRSLEIKKDDPRIDELLRIVKEREAVGYSYEAAEASFELLALRALSNVPKFFDVESFRVIVERRHNALGELVTVSEATVKVYVDGASVVNVGEGNGPVNALDHAFRKDLGNYQSYISDVQLVDYKVRVLTGGTDAVTRVLVESTDSDHNRWVTVGVSPNIVDASFEALIDSINYKLLRDGAPAP